MGNPHRDTAPTENAQVCGADTMPSALTLSQKEEGEKARTLKRGDTERSGRGKRKDPERTRPGKTRGLAGRAGSFAPPACCPSFVLSYSRVLRDAVWFSATPRRHPRVWPGRTSLSYTCLATTEMPPPRAFCRVGTRPPRASVALRGKDLSREAGGTDAKATRLRRPAVATGSVPPG